MRGGNGQFRHWEGWVAEAGVEARQPVGVVKAQTEEPVVVGKLTEFGLGLWGHGDAEYPDPSPGPEK